MTLTVLNRLTWNSSWISLKGIIVKNDLKSIVTDLLNKVVKIDILFIMTTFSNFQTAFFLDFISCVVLNKSWYHSNKLIKVTLLMSLAYPEKNREGGAEHWGVKNILIKILNFICAHFNDGINNIILLLKMIKGLVLISLLFVTLNSFTIRPIERPLKDIPWPFTICGTGSWTIESLNLNSTPQRNTNNDITIVSQF